LDFFQAHFSDNAVSQFDHDFLNKSQQPDVLQVDELEQWPEDDGLGYYEDGVKRTLTDEQIEIFRHSELQEQRRKQEKAKLSSQRREMDSPKARESEAETTNSPSISAGIPADFQSTKRKKKRAGNKQRLEPKPDLRKRTWDVVEAGLDTLDYD
jgi:hypothetical protein